MAAGMKIGLDVMVSARDLPVWHEGTGTDVRKRKELITCDEARQIAYPWEPEASDIQLPTGPFGVPLILPNHKAIVRNDLPLTDINRFLGIVGDGYEIISHQTITDIGNAITSNGAHCDTAGSLHGGQRVYMSLLLPGTAKVKDDKIAQYLILTTSHDGTAAFTFLLAPIRVVCQNTLSASFARQTASFAVRHTKMYEDRIEIALAAMKQATDYFGEHTRILRNLADIKITRDQAKEYFKKVIGMKDKKEGKKADRAFTRGTNIINRLDDLFNGKQIGGDQDAVKGTLYGAVNALAQWIDTERPTRVHGKSETDTAMNARIERDNRVESVLFGSGAQMRDKAMALAVAMTN